MSLVFEKFRNHPILLYADELKNLCKPLEYLNITTFTHLQVDANNQLTGLSNHPTCWINYMEKNYFDCDPLVMTKSEKIDIGRYLVWDTVDCYGEASAMVQDAADFGFKHVFTIIKKEKDLTHFYNFGANLSDSGINQVYVNNIDLLDRFIGFFNSSVKRSKNLVEAYAIVMNSNKKQFNNFNHKETFLSSRLKEEKSLFLQTLLNSKSTPYYLTRKELECAKLLVEGKTAKEIARICCLSFRTIEDRINSLKQKLNARNKSELIAKLTILL
jgi:DNA-binding CsgD family transcriptional regulator